MPRDLNDPQILRFLTENMNKEHEKRLQWFSKNMLKVMEAAKFPENYRDIRTADVGKANLNIYLPGLSKHNQNSMQHRRKTPIRDGQLLGLSALSATKLKDIALIPIPVMYPVDPIVEEIFKMRLPYGGRSQYLKRRSNLNPEDKYYNEQTSNSGYGWRLKDSHLRQHAPKFGRNCTFIRNLYSRTGPHADPSYYQQPPREPYSKCNALLVSCAEPGLLVAYKNK